MALNQQKVAELKAFVELLKKDPQVLHSPELSFFKTYLESMHAEIPPAAKPAGTKNDSGGTEKENKGPQKQTSEDEASNTGDEEDDEEDDIEDDTELE